MIAIVSEKCNLGDRCGIIKEENRSIEKYVSLESYCKGTIRSINKLEKRRSFCAAGTERVHGKKWMNSFALSFFFLLSLLGLRGLG